MTNLLKLRQVEVLHVNGIVDSVQERGGLRTPIGLHNVKLHSVKISKFRLFQAAHTPIVARAGSRAFHYARRGCHEG